jgi:hypothetical protein
MLDLFGHEWSGADEIGPATPQFFEECNPSGIGE